MWDRIWQKKRYETWDSFWLRGQIRAGLTCRTSCSEGRKQPQLHFRYPLSEDPLGFPHPRPAAPSTLRTASCYHPTSSCYSLHRSAGCWTWMRARQSSQDLLPLLRSRQYPKNHHSCINLKLPSNYKHKVQCIQQQCITFSLHTLHQNFAFPLHTLFRASRQTIILNISYCGVQYLWGGGGSIRFKVRIACVWTYHLIEELVMMLLGSPCQQSFGFSLSFVQLNSEVEAFLLFNSSVFQLMVLLLNLLLSVRYCSRLLGQTLLTALYNRIGSFQMVGRYESLLALLILHFVPILNEKNWWKTTFIQIFK